MKIFVSPHNDDETLFGAFTILREKPHVVIVYDSYVQKNRGFLPTVDQRRRESLDALEILGVPKEHVHFLGFRDDCTVSSSDIARRIELLTGGEKIEELFLPAQEADGHPQHNIVSGVHFYGGLVSVPLPCHYLTYTFNGKSKSGLCVPLEHPGWIKKKLQALACYESQFSLEFGMGCWPHFLRSQEEYYA
jgi:LmbE family N-acetylglucosaminyl deacetylase